MRERHPTDHCDRRDGDDINDGVALRDINVSTESGQGKKKHPNNNICKAIALDSDPGLALEVNEPVTRS